MFYKKLFSATFGSVNLPTLKMNFTPRGKFTPT